MRLQIYSNKCMHLPSTITLLPTVAFILVCIYVWPSDVCVRFVFILLSMTFCCVVCIVLHAVCVPPLVG